MIPNKPYPPRACRNSLVSCVREHSRMLPSGSMSRNFSTVEATGDRSGCHPWAFTLKVPPIEKSLLLCITSTERPRSARKLITFDHLAPAWARSRSPSISKWSKPEVSTCKAPSLRACLPNECLAPKGTTASFSVLARSRVSTRIFSASVRSEGSLIMPACSTEFSPEASSILLLNIRLSRSSAGLSSIRNAPTLITG